MRDDLREELTVKAKENLPMTLTAEEVKEVVAALAVPTIIHDPDVFVGEASEPPEGEPPIVEEPAETELPPDFPGWSALTAAGLLTVEQVRAQRDSEEGLTAIPGIGDKTAAQIEEVLS